MIQTKTDLEEFYKQLDPWKITSSYEDIKRKKMIIGKIKEYGTFERACDIAAGEGWITKELPAKLKFAIELSDNAASRLPKYVHRIKEPEGEYDLMTCFGALYPQYNWRQMLDWIKNHSSNLIVISGIKDWLVPDIQELGEPIYEETFKYRQYRQRLMIWKK